MEEGFRDVLFDVAGPVATLVLNRPGKLNAVTPRMTDAVRGYASRVNADGGIRAVVLTGAGERSFCAGSDVSELDAYGTAWEFRGRPDYCDAVRSIRKPVIAAVNGIAAGAGLGLAIACDIRVAASSATFRAAWGRVGLVPDAGSAFFLPRMVGWGRALDMVLTGEPVTADEALRIGLVTHVWPDAEFATKWRELAETLARGATEAFALSKEGLNAGMARGFDEFLEHEADLQDRAGRTRDYAEGVRAFSQKRPAKMEGR